MDDDNYLAQQRTVKGTGRPVEGDTHQVSNQPTPLSPHHWCTDAYPQCQTSTQLTMTQQPHDPSQPHKQLLMGWIVGSDWTTRAEDKGEWKMMYMDHEAPVMRGLLF